jgi:serine/threonine protein phosphatase 1
MRTFDRILAISDVHGENDKFIELLKKTEYNPASDLLVVCGDMIDRGTQNLATIRTCQKLQQQGAVILKGNHEQFAEECIKDMLAERPSEALQLWVANGGGETYDQLFDLSKTELKDLLSFIRRLPLYYIAGDYIFVHAGVNPQKPIEQNVENDLVWCEDRFYYCPAYKGKTVIFGHTPTFILTPYKRCSDEAHKRSAKVWYDSINKDKIGIDCGGVFGGRFAALELPSGKEFYI